jgi:hypothetical protein
VRDSETGAQQAADTSAILTEISALRQEVVALRRRLESEPAPGSRS